MVAKEFIVTKDERLSKTITNNLTDLSYEYIQKLIRNKDIKLNGKRVSKDMGVFAGDTIVVYLSEKQSLIQNDIKYSDKQIVVVYKHRGIETCDSDDCLLNRLMSDLKIELFSVHRLDRNTEGLVIFAKTVEAQKELVKAIKEHRIQKFYYALVFGLPCKKYYDLVAYLRKNSEKSTVEISDPFKKGYVKIETKFERLASFDGKALLSVELVSGKTHQIRAHLAHVGFPIVGDEKYGDSKLNKIERKRYQCLCSYKIKFNLNQDSFLSYLNNLNVKIDKSEIDFCKNL